MALNIIGASTWQNAQRGVQFQETGISIRRWAVRYYPEINEKLPDNAGQIIARAVADVASREVTIEGEVTGTGGIMNLFFAAAVAYVFQNDLQWGTVGPGQPPITGFIILDEVTETQERAAWRSINMRVSSNPNCHA